ncbi:MAG: SDR family oxidoreductase [Gammaproteobacteria bacterium]|nr:SDR family oxidoreductase [Gammaproteobacteria bacterium]
MPRTARTFIAQCLATLIGLAILLQPGVILAEAPEVQQPTVLITGANRGIGFELARQYAERGWGVIATCRTPDTADALRDLQEAHEQVVIERIDVTDFPGIDALAARYRDVPIDILINNAGILGGNERQKFGTFDYAAFDEVMAVNTRGPIKMVETFVDNVAASDQKKIMNISSYVGSISQTFGGQNFYRASKAALNMSMRTIARELKYSKDETRKGIIVGLIDPGVVDTGFAKKVPIPMISAAESAAGVIAVIDGYTRKETGTFLRYDGKSIPW